jgi:hypothetical protein
LFPAEIFQSAGPFSMKDKGISRDVGGRKRSSGDAPNLGQISRMAGAAEPALSSANGGVRRRRRSSEEGGGGGGGGKKSSQVSKSVTLVWTATFGVLGLILIGLVFVFWLKPLLDRREKMAASVTRPAKMMPVDTVLESPSLGEKEATLLAKRAMNARSADEVAKSIISGGVPAAEIVTFLKNLKQSDGDVARYDWISRLDTTRTDVEGVLVTFKKGDVERNRLILLSPDGGKEWKMDYAAFARLATPPWGDLTSGKAKSSVVRVYLADDQYFNGPFTEAEGYKCYGLASPDVPDLLFGYCKAGTQQNLAIVRTLENGRKLMRMTLEIEKIDGAEPRQYLIKRVLAQDWALGKTPLDEE